MTATWGRDPAPLASEMTALRGAPAPPATYGTAVFDASASVCLDVAHACSARRRHGELVRTVGACRARHGGRGRPAHRCAAAVRAAVPAEVGGEPEPYAGAEPSADRHADGGA